MTIKVIETTPFSDQKPGTAGLRESVARFREPHYLNNFIQSVFDSVPDLAGARLVIGGDGRHFNREAAQTLIRMAVANGVSEIILGADAILSTPAAAHLVALEGAAGGFLLTASHNPGGPDGDFGIKFNVRGGGQASAELTDRIHARSLQIREYREAHIPLPRLDDIGLHSLSEGCRLRIVDPVNAHADLMESQFDFPAIARWLQARPGRFLFDAMHAVTGPYAREVFVRRLGGDDSLLLNASPREDFAGGHPDPNPVDAADFVARFATADAPDLGGASDGDGDRNMIVGPGRMVSPCDSLAIICANHDCIPGLAGRLKGVARSMPTSRALDTVAQALGIPCHETPTGWRFFASLLDAGQIQLCGEESFGTSSDHVREKDGLWAVLAWMQMLASHNCSVDELLERHWQRFGRHYFVRHDHALSSEQGDAVMAHLDQHTDRGRLTLGGYELSADSFSYTDPISGHTVTRQGIRLHTDTGGRIVFRLSGTGTQGATLRIYLEQAVAADADWRQDRDGVLEPLSRLALEAANLRKLCGETTPTAVI
ncbi:alpha-D-glucose phosphate-specific phosphoglucomutase [Natronospira bacteriovora]|uniref:phosphoglucomutase (alpha-D-glucose-1,6-bisphosphate-dependent) n=1 Tax=Natronospira bacteriovora TaxID=3069753 RepID=A0ABU0W304_9GAMM|nr:alpha-D-glucose phosphate-specific phosphoglucomutase [Natronospira sp. AB-CW4]MDQ2068396.1 alpha-D-glucose phosphate-specific phosphoglucomutase [Natronospira sp. AB-CW4]